MLIGSSFLTSQENRNKHTVSIKLYRAAGEIFSVTRKPKLSAILHVSTDFSFDENLR